MQQPSIISCPLEGSAPEADRATRGRVQELQEKIIVAWSGGGTGNDHPRLERRGHRKRSSSLGAAGAQETIPEGIAQQANGFVSVVICQQMAHLGCTVVAGKGV